MAKQIKKHGKTALILGLILMLVLMYLTIPTGKALQITNRRVTISDSRKSQTGVEYAFFGNFSNTSVQCIKVQFCSNASGSCSTSTVTIDVSSANKGTSSNWGPPFTYASWTIATRDNTNKIITATSTGEAGSTTSTKFSFGSLTNPSATGTYFAWITTFTNSNCSSGQQDTGVVALAIVEGVTVQATVAESLTFTIGSATSGECTGDTGSPTVVNSATTSVDFGELSINAFKAACQKLNCNTNAAGGYNLTSQESSPLTYGTSTIQDTNCDGGPNCTESTFQTWGTVTNYGFGHSCENTTGNACASGYNFTVTPNYRQFASTTPETPQTMMSASGATSTTAKVHYKISIGSAQAAGTYSNTIVYIATPTY